jgi:outer membrane protein
MKKVLLSAVALLAFGFANAQEEEAKTFGFAKGDMFVEGNINFSTVKEDYGDGFEDTTSNFNFNPKAGYFLTDKIALGVELGVGSSKFEESYPGGSDESKSNNFGAGVFARYYFLDLGQRFKTYTEAGLGFGSRKWETNGVETRKDSNFGLGIDLGIQYFVTPKMAINFGLADVLAFQSGKSEFPGGDETKVTALSGNFNVFNNFFSAATFGLTYKF